MVWEATPPTIVKWLVHYIFNEVKQLNKVKIHLGLPKIQYPPRGGKEDFFFKLLLANHKGRNFYFF